MAVGTPIHHLNRYLLQEITLSLRAAPPPRPIACTYAFRPWTRIFDPQLQLRRGSSMPPRLHLTKRPPNTALFLLAPDRSSRISRRPYSTQPSSPPSTSASTSTPLPSPSSPTIPSRLLRALRSLYTLDGGKVEIYNAMGRFKWQLRLTLRVTVILGTALACVTALLWAGLQMYVEYLHPTPGVFSDKTRIGIRYVYLYGEVLDDKILANETAKGLPEMLEKEIASKGGWGIAPDKVKEAVVSVLLKFASLKTELGRNEEAIAIFEDLIKKDFYKGERLSGLWYKLAQTYSRAERPAAAFDAYIKATQTAWEALFVYPLSSSLPPQQASIPMLDYAKPVLPPPSKDIPPPSRELLDAAMAVAREHCKTDPPQPAVAFAIFLSLLRAAEHQPYRDVCREAAIQAYLGEIMWSLGKTSDGYGWTLKALEGAEEGLRAGKGRTCRECAEYAVSNIILMRKELGGAEDALEQDIKELRKRERAVARFL